MFDQVRQVVTPVGGRAKFTGDEVCYPQLPFVLGWSVLVLTS